MWQWILINLLVPKWWAVCWIDLQTGLYRSTIQEHIQIILVRVEAHRERHDDGDTRVAVRIDDTQTTIQAARQRATS